MRGLLGHPSHVLPGRLCRAAAGAGPGQPGRTPALTHDPGGRPGECVSIVSVVGTEPG